MRCRLALALVTALAAQHPAADAGKKPLTLELRVFNGTEEVTAQTRATVHRAGERGKPVVHASSSDGRIELQLPADIYDVQTMHERDGRVLNIRWANRVVLMPYPDEPGHHLEVINFKNGFGALQIRNASGRSPDVALYEPGKPDRPAAAPLTSASYVLFVVRAGSYDLLAGGSGPSSAARRWHTRLDVPLDRTRLWVTP
jgi:hypothetical protein